MEIRPAADLLCDVLKLSAIYPISLVMDQKTADASIHSAMKIPAVFALYLAVDGRSPITIRPTNAATWGSTTTTSGTVIDVAKTNHPTESLFHELLHADLKLNGYLQHLTFVRISQETIVQSLAGALDNELQHHRMFKEFVDAGFSPELFYNDEDDQTYIDIRKELKRTNPKKCSAASYFLQYLSVIAPGGAGGEEKRKQLENLFRAKVPKDKMKQLDEAAKELINWGTLTAIDPGPTIVKILESLGPFDGWWIGTSQNFPDDGYFTGSSFTPVDANRYARANP